VGDAVVGVELKSGREFFHGRLGVVLVQRTNTAIQVALNPLLHFEPLAFFDPPAFKLSRLAHLAQVYLKPKYRLGGGELNGKRPHGLAVVPDCDQIAAREEVALVEAAVFAGSGFADPAGLYVAEGYERTHQRPALLIADDAGKSAQLRFLSRQGQHQPEHAEDE